MASSERYKRWITSIPFAWMGEKARKLWGGFAHVVGDLTIDWMRKALHQHHPELADDAAQPLIGSGRRTYRGRTETLADFKARLPRAIVDWSRAETPLGMLFAMYMEGFTGAVLVQQNGLAYELPDPDPSDPESALVVTELGGNPDLDDHPWWRFDDDDEYCSRFAILFPSGLTTFARIAFATFDGTEDGETVPWPFAVFDPPFSDATYQHAVGVPIGTGPVSMSAIEDGTKTASQIAVAASGPGFVGVVPVLAWKVGDSPFASMTASDLARLRRIVRDWKPARARCVGLYVLISGEFWDWPVGTWDEPGGFWGPPGDVVHFEMEI